MSNLSCGNLSLHFPAQGYDEPHGNRVGCNTGASCEWHEVVEVVDKRQDRVEDVIYVLKHQHTILTSLTDAGCG